jgi:hypothetical protein
LPGKVWLQSLTMLCSTTVGCADCRNCKMHGGLPCSICLHDRWVVFCCCQHRSHKGHLSLLEGSLGVNGRLVFILLICLEYHRVLSHPLRVKRPRIRFCITWCYCWSRFLNGFFRDNALFLHPSQCGGHHHRPIWWSILSSLIEDSTRVYFEVPCSTCFDHLLDGLPQFLARLDFLNLIDLIRDQRMGSTATVSLTLLVSIVGVLIPGLMRTFDN